MSHVLAVIPTKDRYLTTLPLALQAVALQTRPPDELLIVDDTNQPKDLRELPLYQYLFELLKTKKINWSVLFGKQQGQHHSHQLAQDSAKELVWRLDDDNAPEPNVLETLLRKLEDKKVGAAGGLIIPPPGAVRVNSSTSRLAEVDDFNIQWSFGLDRDLEAEHLYSTFLYRKGLAKYELSLSPAAHREETIFSYRIFRSGYKLIITPECVTWHYRFPEGGIRKHTQKEFWDHDEQVFQQMLAEWGVRIEKPYLVYLDNGLGDHIVFKKLLPEIKQKHANVVIACCYPEVFKGEKILSIADAKQYLNGANPEYYDVYKFMWDHQWTRPLIDAFREIYK